MFVTRVCFREIAIESHLDRVILAAQEPILDQNVHRVRTKSSARRALHSIGAPSLKFPGRIFIPLPVGYTYDHPPSQPPANRELLLRFWIQAFRYLKYG